MIRSVFFATGIFLMVLGAQSLIVDKLVLTNRSQIPRIIAGNRNVGERGFSTRYAAKPFQSPFRTAGYQGGPQDYYSNAGQTGFMNGPKRIYQTKDWMPWSLLAAGTVVILYTYSLGGGKSEG